jgi:hypothetical protein
MSERFKFPVEEISGRFLPAAIISVAHLDEEMVSDNEFNRNLYKYRDGNALEKEEYDQNDYDEKDNDETTRYPWLKPSYIKKNELEDDDKDNELYNVNDNGAEVVE